MKAAQFTHSTARPLSPTELAEWRGLCDNDRRARLDNGL